ncbi:hypothetical protein FHR92_000669 [Fontibacillus solani]|uniref:DUF4097 domain-containing protein n=1 Tax=Fontibacillus solani TaxID=1572857 RepID=A0A7W3XQ92_9BACL|nr:DUF4097 family beta strand repeat-containing protein [Fontibacillus solani]MBA9084215.1 hypothetical protein [Fontibacillus solani]
MMVFNSNLMILRKEQHIVDAVTAISLEWLTGEVRILASETDDVRIIQYTSNNFSDKKLVQIDLQAGMLRIADGRRRYSRIGFNINTTVLEVYLPKKKLHSFSMNGAGSHVFIQNLEAGLAKFRLTSSHATISGKYDKCEINAIGTHFAAEDIAIYKLNLRSTSSKIEIAGEIFQIHVNATGRGINIHSFECLMKSNLYQPEQVLQWLCRIMRALFWNSKKYPVNSKVIFQLPRRALSILIKMVADHIVLK